MPPAFAGPLRAIGLLRATSLLSWRTVRPDHRPSCPLRRSASFLSERGTPAVGACRRSRADDPHGVWSVQRAAGPRAATGEQRGSRRLHQRPSGSSDEQRKRPNHFLSWRIECPNVSERVHEVQRGMVERDPGCRPHLIPLHQLHMTLFVFRLEDDEQKAAAAEVLERCAEDEELLRLAPAEDLILRGVGAFGSRVVWMGVEEGPGRDALGAFVDSVHARFAEAGVVEGGGRLRFTPHVTLAKAASGSIGRETWAPHAARRFGAVRFDRVQLSAMMEKEADGYYRSLAGLLLPAAAK